MKLEMPRDSSRIEPMQDAEHLLRSNRNLCKRFVCLSDNLPLVLSATKGRGKSRHPIGPLRRLATLGLATGSKVHVRWVPSELNVADAPSRAICQWHALKHAKWWEDSDLKLPQAFPKPEPPHKAQRKGERARKPDLPRITKCLRAHSEGLTEPLKSGREVAGNDGLKRHGSLGPGSRTRGVCERALRPREGDRLGCAAVGCGEVLPSSARTEHRPPNARTTRTLKTWSLAAPCWQMMGWGRLEMGLRLLIQFSCYLRPGECANLFGGSGQACFVPLINPSPPDQGGRYWEDQHLRRVRPTVLEAGSSPSSATKVQAFTGSPPPPPDR